MAKAKAANSNKVSFGKRKVGSAQKSFNKHSPNSESLNMNDI